MQPLHAPERERQKSTTEESLLFPVARKTLARVPLNHLGIYLELSLVPESQFGFCRGHVTIDMILPYANFRSVRSKIMNSIQPFGTS